MAKTKATGATKLGRDSKPKYLGVKLFEGEKTKALLRQTEELKAENKRLREDA